MNKNHEMRFSSESREGEIEDVLLNNFYKRSLSLDRSSATDSTSVPILLIIPARTFLVVVASSWTVVGFLLLRTFVFRSLLYIS